MDLLVRGAGQRAGPGRARTSCCGQTRWLKGEDPIRVTLTIADTLQEVTLPADLAAAPAADEQASVFFGKLSNRMQRYHAGKITAAESADTRQRRIDKATPLFRAGKQR
jgi:hypothetical protein